MPRNPTWQRHTVRLLLERSSLASFRRDRFGASRFGARELTAHPNPATAADNGTAAPAPIKYRHRPTAAGRLHSSTVQHCEATLRASSTRGACHDDPFF